MVRSTAPRVYCEVCDREFIHYRMPKHLTGRTHTRRVQQLKWDAIMEESNDESIKKRNACISARNADPGNLIYL